jgi:NADH:ubiquinone oxidoreductase subunit 3 (subunit A)
VSFDAFVGSTIAFILIVTSIAIIYMLGRRAAPKPVQSAAELSTYACGENISFPQVKVNVSLYKYLIYFVILDSSVLLLAFASFLEIGINIPLVVVYLFMILSAGLLLFEGGKKDD